MAANYSISKYPDTWEYLVNWVLVVILGLSFVFYFARLVAYIITLLLRILVWNRYHVSISVGAFRISPLGGRIMARNLVISNADYTISILRFNLTWRYWLLKMTRVPEYCLSSQPESSEDSSPSNLEQNGKFPTRLQLHIDGLEVFMYNRTVAFDNIAQALETSNMDPDDSLRHNLSSKLSTSSFSSSEINSEMLNSNRSVLKFMLSILPLQIFIKRGAFVQGNHTTPNILVASFRTGISVLDLCKAPSSFDPYRTKLDLTMEKFQVSLKPNISYNPDNLEDETGSKKKHRTFHRHDQISRFLDHVTFKHFRSRRRRQNELEYQWHGLRRYIGDSWKEKVLVLSNIEEYAKYSLILDSASTQIVYYYDCPGLWPTIETMSGDTTPPHFGVELIISMGTIHYGSWADRQRGPLQAQLFPTLARDSKPSESLNAPGSLRKYNGFNLSVTAKDDLIFRIPTRELSKEKEDLSNQDANSQSKNTRPFGWVELKFGPGTKLSHFTSYVATSNGWPNGFTLQAMGLEVRTSVTHDILLQADEHTIKGDIGFPLKWNGECNWGFDMKSENAQFFFLGEHITLFSDLITDFASGPQVKFENYKPFRYDLSWNIQNYKLYFNVNDHNIINDPLDFDSNKYLCFSGKALQIDFTVPLRGPFVSHNTVEYKILTPQLDLSLEVPAWHTVSAFMFGGTKMGNSDTFEISGSYTYYNQIEVNNNNFVVVNAVGDNVVLLFYGFLIRYLFTFRENYFGDFVKFKTFEEYLLETGNNSDYQPQNTEASSTTSKNHEYWKQMKTENNLNVLFTFQVRKGMIILPGQIYDHANHVSLCFDSLDVDIHICHYYMDLQADFSTGSGYHFIPDAVQSTDLVFNLPMYQSEMESRSPDIVIDCFSVHTHRMLGVDKLTYHCKWDFACDLISIDSKPLFLNSLKSIISNFTLGFKDLDNTLIYQIPTVYDAANFSFRCPTIKLRLATVFEDTFLELEIDQLFVTFNDIANSRYSSRIVLTMPSIVMRIVHELNEKMYNTYLKTSLTLTNFCQKRNMLEHRRLQQEHIKRNDATTHRVSFLLFPENIDTAYQEALGSTYPTVSLPSASIPLNFSKADHYYDKLSEDNTATSFCDATSEGAGFLFGLEPTIDYYEEDFKPRGDPDPNFKHDSYIFEFGDIKLFSDPKGLEILSGFKSSGSDLNLDILLDRLQCEMIKELSRLILPISMIDNFRIVIPSVDIKLVENSVHNPETMFLTASPVPVITISVIEISLVLSLKKTRVREGSILLESSSTTLASNIREIYCSVSFPDTFSSAMSCQVSEMDIWFTKTENKGFIGSINPNSIKLDLDVLVFKNVLNLISSLSQKCEDIRKIIKSTSNSSKNWKGELIYLLCCLANENSFQSDPRLLTRPVRILRTQNEHVRFNESWKIIMKLRSIAAQLRTVQTESLNLNDIQSPPSDAIDVVLRFFKSWRTWEGNMNQREYYIKHSLFSKAQTTKEFNIFLSTQNFSVTFHEAENSRDVCCLQKLGLQLVRGCRTNLLNSLIPLELDSPLFEVIANLQSCDLVITPTFFTIIKALDGINLSHSTSLETHENLAGNAIYDCGCNLVLNVTQLHCKAELLKTHVEANLSEFSSSTLALLSRKVVTKLEIVEAMKYKAFEFSFGQNFTKYFNYESRESVLNIMELMHNSETNIIIDFEAKETVFAFLDPENTLCSVIQDILEIELPYIRQNLEFISHRNEKKKDEETTQSKGKSKLPIIKASLDFAEIQVFVDCVNPVTLRTILSENKLLFVHDDEAFVEISQKRSNSEVNVQETSILRAESSYLHAILQIANINDVYLLKVSVKSEYFKVVTPSILKAVNSSLLGMNSFMGKLTSLKNSARTTNQSNKSQSNVVVEKGTNSHWLDSVVFQFSLHQSYCGWSTYKDRTRFTIEFEGMKTNISSVDNTGSLRVLPHGELQFPATRVTIVDSLLPVGLSTLVDFDLSIKVLNDSKDVVLSENRQSLQVESEYSRICGSPQILLKIFELSDALRQNLSKHSFTTKPFSMTKQTNENTTTRPRFSSVHLLSYNFCIGWLFGKPFKDFPGFILGAERIFAVTSASMGKLTVMDGYLSVANGSTSSSFYSSASEMGSLNRAFMPKLQLNYYVDLDKKLWMNFKGDELDVRFMSTSAVVLERTMSSVTQVRAYFDKKGKATDSRRRNTMDALTRESKISIHSSKILPGPRFSAIQCTFGFAGAKVYFYKLQEDDFHGNSNSLFLQSPAVQISAGYEHAKSSKKRHNFKIELLMSESDNTIYASCIPVVSEFIDSFKAMFQASSDDRDLEALSDTTMQHDSNFSPQFRKLIQDIDLHIGMIIERQRVSLSCEPTAKVAAIIEYDGASISACSSINEDDSIYVFGQLKSISASLQHVYSDKRSVSLFINGIIFSNAIKFQQNMKISSLWHISDISGTVKMNQYQDVDLFADIWYPKKYRSRPKKTAYVPAKIKSPVEERHTFTAMSVSFALDFIVTKVSLEADFGAALGVMVLSLSEAWVLTRTISRWSYSLNFGLGNLVITSEGRLGGFILVDRLFLNSAIEWKLKDMPILTIPLVHMAAGFDKIQFKSIFDDHVFAFVNLNNWGLDAYNRKNGENISKDHLFVTASYESIEVFLTSLAASDFYDIYNTISRMIEEKRNSYKEILNDSERESFVASPSSNDILEVVKKLETKIQVFTGITTVHVYPHSFHDSKALVINLDHSTAQFTQNEFTRGVSNHIELQLNNVKAAFSNTAGTSEQSIRDFDVSDFSEYAKKAKGGYLLVFPRFMISMRTYQKYDTNLVEYLFQSSFGGTVDIGWNLGSINCVKEMYSAHKRALQSRTEFSKTSEVIMKGDLDIPDTAVKSSDSTQENSTDLSKKALEASDAVHEDFDRDIQETIEKVSNTSKFTYTPLAPPIIEAPQLKELGNATPPLEWFGLHRNKFPDATHQLVIVTLQKFIHEIEQEYSKTLGRA